VAGESDLASFELQVVEIDRIETDFAALRSRTASDPSGLASPPIRVVAGPDRPDRYQVVDGFKRLADYRDRGLAMIPVLLEPTPCDAWKSQDDIGSGTRRTCACLSPSLPS